MSPIAIVMMILFMLAIWGGLFAAIMALSRADRARIGTPGQGSAPSRRADP